VIEQLLDLVRRRAGAQGEGGADCLWRQSERTSIAFESGRLKTAGITEEAGVNLRVLSGGRVGIAGSTAMDAAPAALVERALASAELGEPLALVFPPSAALPRVPTLFERAGSASLDALIAIGRDLAERLAREGCQVNVNVEREIASTRVANTVGADGTYRSTGVAISAEVWRISGNDVLAIADGFEGADLPTREAIAALVHSIESRLEPALTIVDSPEGSLPVVFTPAGLSALFLPVTQALSGKAVLQGISPLAGKVGEQIFDPAFTLVDDPLTAGRSASRPIDDECVPSRVTRLVEKGVVKQFLYDLETAARAGTASTGHGQRGIFSKPVPSYSNIVIGDGKNVGARHVVPLPLGGGLIADIKNGLLVDDLIGVGQGNVIGGAFSHPVALAYRIERGQITGRVKDAAIAGNSYELLKHIGGFGNDRRWYGARSSPSLLLEGVSVAGR
jgi:PmbA protein